MTYLTSPLVTEKGKHRLHAYLNRLLVLTAGLGLAINSVIRGTSMNRIGHGLKTTSGR